jgi:AcrR family transcriptional regulator
MEEIAREAGKGKSSLYYYFPSKYEIFEAVVDQEIDELLKLAYRAVEKAATARDKLKAYCKVRLHKTGKLGNLSRVIRNDLMDNIEVILKIRKKHELTQVNMIREILAEGVASGEFKHISAADMDLVALLFTATLAGITLPACLNQHMADLPQRADIIVDVMVDGIGQ